jgi:hypothetical protein
MKTLRGAKISAATLPEQVASEIREFHRIIDAVVSKAHPLRQRLKQRYERNERLSLATERYARNEISDEAFKKTKQELLELAPRPPKWLPDGLGELIADVLFAEKLTGNVTAPVEFIAWIKERFPDRIGRPVDDVLAPIFKKAAQMKNTPLKNGKKPTWGQVARQLCPDVGKEGHACTKKCVDRIRVGAREYLPLPTKTSR